MIVFPMAGLSRRFTDVGYDVPKFQLPLWGGHVFDYAVASFASSFERTPFLFIYRETGGVRAFIEARTAVLGIKNVRFSQLGFATAGQAETVELGLDAAEVSYNTPLTIFNIDTFRRPERSPFPLTSKLSGWLEVFHGEGENWSFVKPAGDGSGLVTETAEKVAISDLCSDGLYHFATAALFREALAAERAAPSAAELYIAPIYNHLIANGHPVGYGEIATQDLVFCGIPTEYEALSGTHAPWAVREGAER
ncbi:capsular biosynthesis protein [Roseovarius amoyensis]|uniref:capsular biosynthesis protein n=1 Tax=Roseovarius amoyensis TaxID=2211448 RepID=UPI000DBE3E73|nr:capsular biosynthesis protein [Roseovarius amoyensis]